MQSSSSLISAIYKSRRILLKLMERQGYNVKDYDNFSINEVNSMDQSKQLDMLLEKPPSQGSERARRIYIRYYLGKAIRPQNIHEMIEDLYDLEEILTKDDTLFIVTKEDINETMTSLLKHIWEKDGVFIVMQSIKRLQFNILEHTLVPEHTILSPEEVAVVKQKYNVKDDTQFPDISRFDPVAQAICMRPGQVCRIVRPSKTSVTTEYYRICV
jgi:DNA-directed RNA polymerase I, II, and III subunit RPABC1